MPTVVNTLEWHVIPAPLLRSTVGSNLFDLLLISFNQHRATLAATDTDGCHTSPGIGLL